MGNRIMIHCRKCGCALVVMLTLILAVSAGCSGKSDYSVLEDRIREYTGGKDADIGVAVIFDGRDTIMVNGDRFYPMMSVFKFPQAIAVANFCLESSLTFADTVAIGADEIKLNTYSPMRDRYGACNLRLPLSELLSYSIRQSDNNACDILFRIIGGVAYADSVMTELGFPDIRIEHTEDEMHADISRCLGNRCTPLEMASLLDRFSSGLSELSPEYTDIAAMMESCVTGMDRLPEPLAGTDAVIGHKTGTGDVNAAGRIIGVNDCGYVCLPDGHRYSIAVFIADSAYDLSVTSGMIADISSMVYEYVVRQTSR